MHAGPSLLRALAQAQVAVGRLKRDAFDEDRRYSYVSAETIIEAGKAALADAGLCLVLGRSGLRVLPPSDPSQRGIRHFCRRGATIVHLASMEKLDYEVDFAVSPHDMAADDAWSAALTKSLAYLFRDILLIPRVEEKEEKAEKAGDEPAGGAAMSNTPEDDPILVHGDLYVSPRDIGRRVSENDDWRWRVCKHAIALLERGVPLTGKDRTLASIAWRAEREFLRNELERTPVGNDGAIERLRPLMGLSGSCLGDLDVPDLMKLVEADENDINKMLEEQGEPMNGSTNGRNAMVMKRKDLPPAPGESGPSPLLVGLVNELLGLFPVLDEFQLAFLAGRAGIAMGQVDAIIAAASNDASGVSITGVINERLISGIRELQGGSSKSSVLRSEIWAALGDVEPGERGPLVDRLALQAGVRLRKKTASARGSGGAPGCDYVAAIRALSDAPMRKMHIAICKREWSQGEAPAEQSETHAEQVEEVASDA